MGEEPKYPLYPLYPLWLGDKEVQKLTGMTMPSAQMRVLDTMGYTYRMRPNGTFIVPVIGNIIPTPNPTGGQETEYKMDFSSLEKA